MPIEIKDLDNGLGNIIIGQGIVTEEELFDAFKQYLTQDQEKFSKYRYSLSDYTAAKKLEISTQKVRQIAECCVRSSIVNPKAIVAVVADQDFIYALARMWEILSDGVRWETMVFRNREEAEAWIKKRAKKKYGIDDPKFN